MIVDIIRNVLLFLPIWKLSQVYRHRKSGPLIKYLTEDILFRRLSYSNTRSEDLHNVSISELYQLSKGQIRCRVEYLEIKLDSSHQDSLKEEFGEFCSLAASFLQSIPKVDISITKDFRSGLGSVSGELFEDYNVAPSSIWPILRERVSTTVTNVHLVIENYCGVFSCDDWPESLKSLTFDNVDCMIVDLPSALEGFTSYRSRIVYATHIENLQVLSLQGVDIDKLSGIRMSKSLVKLKLDNVELNGYDFLRGLAHLESLLMINCEITTVDDIHFPPKLRDLDLLHNSIETLGSKEFPSSIKSLNMSDNNLARLDMFLCPEVEELDVSLTGARDPSIVLKCTRRTWYPSLLVLKMINQTSIEWGESGPPQTLSHLEFSVDKKLNFALPRNLKFLHLHTRGIIDHRSVIFPSSLTFLKLVGGTFDYKAWKMPSLEVLMLEDTRGDIIIPKTVEKLSLASSSGHIDVLISSNRLRELHTNRILYAYPESLSVLKVCLERDEPIVNIPPNLEYLELSVPENVQRKFHTVLKASYVKGSVGDRTKVVFTAMEESGELGDFAAKEE